MARKSLAEAAREGIDAEDAVAESGVARGRLAEQANALQIDSAAQNLELNCRH